ncbi:MAG: hypothetical protein WC812_03900 [Candidatus Pacearchaeota archaeon]|jgi:hypothetical protein
MKNLNGKSFDEPEEERLVNPKVYQAKPERVFTYPEGTFGRLCEEQHCNPDILISSETKISLFSKVGNPGYRMYTYKIENNETDALSVYEPWARIELKKDFFLERKNHAKECGRIAKELGLPFELILAVGIEPEKRQALLQLKEKAEWFRELIHELKECGINKRKMSILDLIGRETYDSLDVEGMGQKNSSTIAQFLTRGITIEGYSKK